MQLAVAWTQRDGTWCETESEGPLVVSAVCNSVGHNWRPQQATNDIPVHVL